MNFDKLKTKMQGMFTKGKKSSEATQNFDESDFEESTAEFTGEYEATGEYEGLDSGAESEPEDQTEKSIPVSRILDKIKNFSNKSNGKKTNRFLKHKRPNSPSGSEEESDEFDDELYDEEGEELEPDEAELKKKKIIRYSIFGLILFYLAWDILYPDIEPVKKTPKNQQVTKSKKQAPSRRRSKEKKGVTEKTKTNLRGEGQNKSKKKGKTFSTMNEDPKSQEEDKIEKNEIKDIAIDEAKDFDSQSDLNSSVDDLDFSGNSKNAKKDSNEAQGSAGETQTPKDDLSKNDETIVSKDVENKIEDLKIPLEIGKLLEETKKQIPKEIPYASAPDYTKFGRGLVYNCKLKHWACIDRPRWYECKNNFTHVDFYAKKKECFPVSVYKTSKDCRIIQIYNINKNVDTSFCD